MADPSTTVDEASHEKPSERRQHRIVDGSVNALKQNVVRILGALLCVAPLLVHKYPDVDWATLFSLSAAMLGGAEVAQRVEDRKTARALSEPSPELSAEVAQARLSFAEAQQRAEEQAQASTGETADEVTYDEG